MGNQPAGNLILLTSEDINAPIAHGGMSDQDTTVTLAATGPVRTADSLPLPELHANAIGWRW
ncbi:hypothetical protein ASD63_29765 [Ensifer sp. Root558]|nr:hypothetical protein ASD63_29765 [Ensifer sp. Root558]